MLPEINLQHSIESGQIFTYEKLSENVYRIPVCGNPVELIQCGLSYKAEFSGCSEKELEHFLDLSMPLEPVYDELKSHKKTAPAADHLRGLRLLNQDSWSAFVSFILSANNNVGRIMKMVRSVRSYFLPEEPYLFPSAEQIASSTEKQLRKLGLGYRAPYLLNTCRKIEDQNTLFQNISRMETEEAIQYVMQFDGVGPKVADCILLYACHRMDVFPVDVWIARVMRSVYFRRRKISENEIRKWALKKWPGNAGYVQQYLFHGARTGLIQCQS